MSNDSTVLLPKWAWGVISSLAGFCLLLLTSFFSWLALTAVSQGNAIERVAATVETISQDQKKIQTQLDRFPVREVDRLVVRVEELQNDNGRLENRVSELETKVN